VYFREPSGILFEIATVGPGFTINESVEELGTKLQLPERYEPSRREIEAILPDINGSKPKNEKLTYDHKFVKGLSDKTFILFHGTGGDENDLIPLALRLDKDMNILSIRGKENENGLLRFFKGFEDGTFDQDDIKKRVGEIREFIIEASKFYGFDLEKSIALGFSNGANMITAILQVYGEVFGSGGFFL
jgi:phospholipase/carboxylesterase